MATRAHWLVKSEPSVYSFDQLVADGSTAWTGVRNFTARNNLRAMKKGDMLLFYHSNKGKAIVGIARVGREAFPDPTCPGPAHGQGQDDWSAVDVEPVRALARPVTLAELRLDPVCSKMELLRQSRLSVVPVTPEQFERVLTLAAADADEEGTRAHHSKAAP